jgi:hypothetical protein
MDYTITLTQEVIDGLNARITRQNSGIDIPTFIVNQMTVLSNSEGKVSARALKQKNIAKVVDALNASPELAAVLSAAVSNVGNQNLSTVGGLPLTP